MALTAKPLVVRCWLCGASPDVFVAVKSMDSPDHVVVVRWPVGDREHEHAERPPTPAELADQGHQALRRIMEVS